MKLVLDDGTEVELDKCELIEVGPNDKLWIAIRKQLDDDEFESVADALEYAFGTDRVLLVHGVEAEIKVVREQ